VKVYLDNNIVSALAKDDMPTEHDSLVTLLEFYRAGRVQLVTSEVSGREIQKLNQMPLNLNAVYCLLAKVEFIEDQKLLGINSYIDRHTCINYPMIEDDPTSLVLCQIGLDRTDAHHLILAILAESAVFLTCDVKTILKYRQKIENMFSIKLRKPSELIAELSGDAMTS
jgi:hypothetical protein